MSEPLVSVIMGSFEPRWDRLRRAVSSLVGQTWERWELLLWDDGSSPRGALALEQATRLDPRVRLFRGRERRGLAHGLNQCLRRAAGDYIARLDDDDWCFPQRLERQVAFLREHPWFQWVGAAAALVDGERPWGFLRPPARPRAADFLSHSPFVHPSVVFRRQALELVGGYREEAAFWGCEDYELFARLHALGFRGANLPECLLSYWEDRASYRRRGLGRALREAALRQKALPRLGLSPPLVLWGTLRPVAAGALPGGLRWRWKRLSHG